MARVLTSQDAEEVVEITEKMLKVDDPDKDTKFWVRLLSEKKMRAIRAKHTTRRPNARGQMVEVSDEEEIGFDIVDYVVKDWTGIVAKDASGQLVPVPCEREAKRGLDPHIRTALVDYCTHNQRVEAQAKAESFRPAS